MDPGCGGPDQELSSLVSYAGALGDREQGIWSSPGGRGSLGQLQSRPLTAPEGETPCIRRGCSWVYCSLKTQCGGFAAPPSISGCDAQTELWQHKPLSHLPSQRMFGGGQEKSFLRFVLTRLFWGAWGFLSTLPRGGLVLSALLRLHKALLLVAGGFDLCVGGVVGVVAESHGRPVVRSPLRGYRPESVGVTSPTGDHSPGTALSTETLFTRALGAY